MDGLDTVHFPFHNLESMTIMKYKQFYFKTMTTLKTILLDAINSDLESSDYSNNAILDNTDSKNWSDSDKFEWCFDRYMVEVGGYESLEYWFSGLALSSIPFTYYEIEKLGFDSSNFFQQLSDELQRITGYTDRKAFYNRKIRS